LKQTLLIIALLFAGFIGSAQSAGPDTSDIGNRYTTGIIPQRLGLINDFDGLFSVSERTKLDSLVSAFEIETTAEVGVVTLPANYIDDKGFESYTLTLFRRWGMGKAIKNNGVLLCISPSLRRIRIQNGYGIEARMTDQQTKDILDRAIVPRFKEGNYFEGVYDGVLSIIEHLRRNGG